MVFKFFNMGNLKDLKKFNGIQREILDDIFNEVVSRFEKDPNLMNFEYGQFRIHIYSSNIEIHYTFKNYVDTRKLFDMDLSKETIILLWDSEQVKKYKKLHNKLYKFIKNREILRERETQLKANKQWISWLPEEKQKQLYRNVKLKRIVEDE